MKLSVNLVTWNGAKYMPFLFDSLRKQTFTGWTLLVFDNNSNDNTVELIKKELSNFSVQFKVVENKTNLGFAGGHNQAFKASDAEYVLLLNQDMYLASDCLEKVVAFLDRHPEAAAASPRLMKWDFSVIPSVAEGSLTPDERDSSTSVGMTNGEHALFLQKSFTDQIDALGLKVYRNRRVVEQYAQQDWQSIGPKLLVDSQELMVFGVSGALPAFRMSAVKSVAYADGGIFDESYYSYKEDVDLAYRLAAAGYKSYVLLDAAAYHDRSVAGPKQGAAADASANKKRQSEPVKYHSYKNHLMTLYKNEYWQNFTLDFPWILWYELKKFAYFLLFDGKVLGGLKELFRQDLAKKRRLIKSQRKISWQEMRKWWN